jgi:hypothetical protein
MYNRATRGDKQHSMTHTRACCVAGNTMMTSARKVFASLSPACCNHNFYHQGAWQNGSAAQGDSACRVAGHNCTGFVTRKVSCIILHPISRLRISDPHISCPVVVSRTQSSLPCFLKCGSFQWSLVLGLSLYARCARHSLRWLCALAAGNWVRLSFIHDMSRMGLQMAA